MHTRVVVQWMMVPWIILLFAFGINYLISASVADSEPFNSGGLASLFVWMLAISATALTQTFPFALGLSVRRTDFFLGTAAMIGLVSVFSAVLLFLLSLAESEWAGGWGTHFTFFTFPFMTDLSMISRFGIFFIAILHCCFLGIFLASLYCRFGRNGLFVFFGCVFLALSALSVAATTFGWWLGIFNWLGEHLADLALWAALLTAVYILASYGLLRRSTV